MNIFIEESDDVTILNLQGEFHLGTTGSIEKIWSEQVLKRPRVIMIDCECLEYINASGIGLMIKLINNSRKCSIDLMLLNLNPALQNIFRISKLDMFFDITESEKHCSTNRKDYKAK